MGDTMIDFHAHTSSRPLYGLHTVDASVSQLELLAKQYGVEKIVLLATYFPFKKGGLFNEQLLSRVEGNDLFAVFGSLDASGDLQKGIDELQNLASAKRIKGIKLYPGYQNFDIADARIFPVYELAEYYHLPVAIHSGELHHCCPAAERNAGNRKCGASFCGIDSLCDLSRPYRFRSAIASFPQVPFVLCHLGNPYFAETRALMKECGNVSTDISGQFVTGSGEDTVEYKKLIVEEIKQFLQLPNGYRRVMFATDFPIQSYADSLELVQALRLSSSEEELVCSTNASRLLK